jgi:basic amino acid/polyamine antiporter, APA family
MAIQKPSSLLKILGVGFGVASLVGNSVGLGILRMPGVIAGYLDNGMLIILLWLGGGLFSLLGALIYAEASVAYPFSGGPYVIAERVFGKQAGFTVGACDWVQNIASNAAQAIAITEYFISLTGLPWPKPALGAALMLVLTAVQWFGMRSSSIIQQGLSMFKMAGLLLLVGAFFYHGHGGIMQQNTAPVAMGKVGMLGALILSFRAVFYTYMGWNMPIYFTEEHSEPRISMPRSLIYGVLSITVIYVLVNISLLYLMPLATLANSQMAVADGARLVFGNSAGILVTITGIIIVTSALYPGILSAPRIIYGMGRSGIFFKCATVLNRFHIPGAALLVSGLISVFFIVSGTFEFVIAIATFLTIFIDICVYASAYYARRKNKTRFFFKAGGYPIAHGLIILVNTALLAGIISEDRTSSLYAILVILLTVPLYMVWARLSKAK